jgi:hypothetical protein
MDYRWEHETSAGLDNGWVGFFFSGFLRNDLPGEVLAPIFFIGLDGRCR